MRSTSALGFIAAVLCELFHSGESGAHEIAAQLEPRPGHTLRTELAVNANITVAPKPSAYGDARLFGLGVGGMIFIIGLGGLIFLLIRPSRAPLGGGLLFCGAVMAGGIVLGWLIYALSAPQVLTLDGDSIRFEGPVIRRRIPTMRIQEIVRGWTGRGGMSAYLFVNSRLLLGGIVIFASHYDQVEIERLIAATGRPISGDFTERV